MNIFSLSSVMICVLLVACYPQQNPTPSTVAATANSTIGYTPLDPLAVTIQPCNATRDEILAALPDETMRMSIQLLSGSAQFQLGAATAGVAGQDYRVTLDYLKSDTVSLFSKVEPSGRVALAQEVIDPNQTTPIMAAYVGIGLRLTAHVHVNSGKINLANLFALGAAGQAEQIQGTLVIQTLGITGDGISAALPIPSELSQASVQNAIQAMAAIRAKIYDPKTTIRPRLVGVFNNLGEDDLQKTISFVLQKPVTWKIGAGAACPQSSKNTFPIEKLPLPFVTQ
jgi:hypothetical protein